jgi:predicted amidophosphoribosyltransferase
MVNCPNCGKKVEPRDKYCRNCAEPLRRTAIVSIRTDADTAKFWRQQGREWGEKGKAFRVAVHLLKKELDSGKRLDDLDREY